MSNEEKIIKLLEKQGQQLTSINEEVGAVKDDLRLFKNEMRVGIDGINTRLDDVKASASTFDDMLVENPIPRIKRLEDHLHLPRFALASSEE